MTENAFTTRGLTKVYGEGRSAVHALRGVDLEIPEWSEDLSIQPPEELFDIEIDED